MSAVPQYYPVAGGLDQESAGIYVSVGRAIAVLNHESAVDGYRRTEGYERFDGRDAPSALNPVTQAAGVAARRAAIAKPPGQGPVRGVLWHEGKLHAWRDNIGATEGKVYYSSPTGWQAHSLGFILYFSNAGPYEVVEGDQIEGMTSGATATVRGVYNEADSNYATGNGFGFYILDNVVGTFGNEIIQTPTEDNVAEVEAGIHAVTLPAGGRYQFTIHNFYGAVDKERAYGVQGMGTAFEFDGTTIAPILTGMPDDRPFLCATHKEHLFLAFPKGSLQFSSLGDPRSFVALLGAAEIALGKEITNLIPNTADALLIVTTGNFAVLTGNDSSDYVKTMISPDAGGYIYTAQNVGNVVYMDEGGIRNANSTQTYGKFNLGTYTQLIQKVLQAKRDAAVIPTESATIKSKDQYLLFFSDGSGISLYVGRKTPEAMLFQYPFTVTCAHVATVGNEERVFVGGSDGFVYELNVGTSFDGAPIEAFVQFGFMNQQNPRMLKRYHRAGYQMEADPGAQIAISCQFDYNENPALTHDEVFAATGSGGLWNTAEFGDFTWIAPTVAEVEGDAGGVGRNMSPVVYSKSATMRSYTLQSGFVSFSQRGMMR